ncbi:MAG: glycosyltransferase family 2 protein [Blastocatellia bacterium]
MIPMVLIGIVTWNRAEILPKAITSALSQAYPSLQVALVDNASTDATPELAAHFPKVCWIRWEENRGYMAARNHFMAMEGAAYFVSLDDDAWFLQGDEIRIAVDHLERHPQVAAVAFDIVSPDHPQSAPRTAPHPTAIFIGCGHVLRLSAVHEVGGYEASPGSYGGEEKDLCLRLLDAGYQIVKLPGVHVWHDKTPVARNLAAQHRSGVCNDLVLTLRRTPALILPAVLPVKLFRHWKFSQRNGLSDSCREGFKLFFRSAPGIWKSRRPVKAATLRAFVRLTEQGSPSGA